ncbi:hypothetical protein Tco_0320938 [Tanacetum coccineum]
MGGDVIEVSDDESSDLKEYWSDKEEETAKIFKIETDIFNYETPLCLAFNEFNYILKVDPDLLTKDIMGFKTYEDYKDDWIYEWNENVLWVYDKPWLDNGIWKEPKPVKHTCKPFNYKTGCSEWPTCSWREDGYYNGGNLPGAYHIGENWKNGRSVIICYHDYVEVNMKRTHEEGQSYVVIETREVPDDYYDLTIKVMRRDELIRKSFERMEKEDGYAHRAFDQDVGHMGVPECLSLVVTFVLVLVAVIQLRVASPLTHHPSEIPSPPLLLPSTTHIDDIPEVDISLQKMSSSYCSQRDMEERAPTTVEGLSQRVTDLSTTLARDTHEIHVRLEDAKDDRAL